MFQKRIIYLVLAFYGLSGHAMGQVRDLKDKELYVSGEILVRLKEGVSTESRAKIVAALGESKVLSHPDLLKIKLNGNSDVLQAVERMGKDPSVLFPQPNYCYYALAACPAPTATYFSTPYHWPFL